MEWVETTGRTIEEAKELALDQLGVDSGDAEFEVVEEPKVGLFGRTRGNARVRARVSPRTPRPKTERRRRPKKAEQSRSDAGAPDSTDGQSGARSSGGRSSGGQSSGGRSSGGQGRQKKAAPAEPPAAVADADAGVAQGSSQSAGRRGSKSEPREPMDIEEQIQVLEGFLAGLGESFGLKVETSATHDGDELRVDITGDDLGILVGPRLATLDAIQEIARNTLQRQADGREYARVVVDVQGIRQRRREALTEFVADAANQVRDDDVTVVFEVMSSADRKLVHDVAGELDGVVSVSEGEDPRRRVVLRKG